MYITTKEKKIVSHMVYKIIIVLIKGRKLILIKLVVP